MVSAVTRAFILLTLLISTQRGECETFTLLNNQDSVVGEIRYVRSRSDETLIDIAREFDLGYDQIVKANPSINRWLPDDGAEVVLPQLYILPGATRRGLVLNISELRLYYYPPPKKGAPQEVFTYPVSIGRMDWRTPLGATKVVAKERDPAWRPPRSIREEHARDGDPLPEVIPGGSPENPLGRFALRLGLPTYLIHGVDERKSFGIGMRVTHGCVRMYPEDIAQLFELIPVNTPVMIVDEPIKIGRINDRIFLSVHQPLDEGEDENLPPLPRVSTDAVLKTIKTYLGPAASVPFDLISAITERGDGIPQEIARSIDTRPNKYPEPSQVPSINSPGTDSAYWEAISKHFDTPPQFLPHKPSEVKRPPPSRITDEDVDAKVRKYMEERY